MAYLVVAYPKIGQSDFEWIQGYRKKNDPRYFSVINPHFTLVFAIDDIDQESFLAEAKKQTKSVSPFDFVVNVATINQDDSGDYYHEFLVPDIGHSNIIKLHDKLYSGTFADHLRFDIDFIPHIGIGNSDDVQESKRRIDELNAKELSIAGKVDTIDVIEYKNGVINTIEKLIL